jgi:hypothetical protein
MEYCECGHSEIDHQNHISDCMVPNCVCLVFESSHTQRFLAKPAPLWRYHSFRVFCPNGIVKCYLGNDNPHSLPLWVSNYHAEVPGTRTLALGDIDDALRRIASA